MGGKVFLQRCIKRTGRVQHLQKLPAPPAEHQLRSVYFRELLVNDGGGGARANRAPCDDGTHRVNPFPMAAHLRVAASRSRTSAIRSTSSTLEEAVRTRPANAALRIGFTGSIDARGVWSTKTMVKRGVRK